MRHRNLCLGVVAFCALSCASWWWWLSWRGQPTFDVVGTRYYTPRPACPPPATDAVGVVVIYIPSPIPWRSRRQQVLRTMRGDLGSAHLYFVLGTRAGGPRLEREAANLADARREAAEEKDPRVRYLFTSCRDLGDEPNDAHGTSSTTCKGYEALRYIARAYARHPPRFVWRGADDAHLDLRVFRERVAPRLQTCRLFFGRIRFPEPEGDRDLELLPEHPNLYALYGVRKFGKYMLGMGFCMSWDVVLLLGAAPIPPRLTWAEDVLMGQWLLFHDVDFVDSQQLNDTRIGMREGHEMVAAAAAAAAASHDLLLLHKPSPAQWRALESPGG